MNDRILVQILHAMRHLQRPFDENIRREAKLAHTQQPAQRPSLGILHNQTEVRLLKANSFQLHYIRVAHCPEQLRLLQHILLNFRHVLLFVALHPGLLDRHKLTLPIRVATDLEPEAPIDLAEAPGAYAVLELELGIGNVRWQLSVLTCLL